MVIDISVPATGGEYMDSVVLLEWHVQAGDTVEKGQILAIVETAKATIEIEAPESGKLTELFATPGEEVAVGAVLARLEAGSSAQHGAGVKAAATARVDASPTARPAIANRVSEHTDRIKASPAARRYAREHGIALDAIHASSPSGRIKLRDLHAHTPAPSSSPPSVRTNDLVPLYLERRGGASERVANAQPLIFIHGFAGDSQGWVPLLAKLTVDSPIVLIELPGHGRSPNTDVANVEDLARHVAATLHNNRITAGHIVAHSLGGAIGIALAADPDFKATSVCLLAPAGLGPEINGEVLAGITRAQSADSLYPWLKQLTHNGQQIDRTFADFAMQQRQDPELRRQQRRMAATLFPDGTQAHDMRDALNSINVPTRIIWGRDDAIIPWQHALRVGGHAGLHLLPAVGHLPHIERPLEVARIIEELVRSANRGS